MMKGKTLTLVLVCLLPVPAFAGSPVLYYNIVSHGSGSDCASAKNSVTNTKLYHGTSSSGVPTVTDASLTYTVESLDEATQLCNQVGGTPADILDPDQASQYQPGMFAWTDGDASTADPNDSACNVSATTGMDYTYLQLAGHCN